MPRIPSYRRRLFTIAFLCLALGAGAQTTADAVDAARLPATDHPTPGLAPDEVTRIQLEALRHNTESNAGIALTFAFASPANRRTTGPLPRFVNMLRSPPYDSLLNHAAVEYGDVAVRAERAFQAITVTAASGKRVSYVWVLSRQREGECAGCWMTDAVIATERPAPQRFAAVVGG